LYSLAVTIRTSDGSKDRKQSIAKRRPTSRRESAAGDRNQTEFRVNGAYDFRTGTGRDLSVSEGTFKLRPYASGELYMTAITIRGTKTSMALVRGSRTEALMLDTYLLHQVRPARIRRT
jgi:hypothetical protein